MATKKTSEKPEVPGVAPEVVERVVNEATKEGVPPEVAKDILEDTVAEGVAPDKVGEVAEEAVRVEREDREAIQQKLL